MFRKKAKQSEFAALVLAVFLCICGFMLFGILFSDSSDSESKEIAYELMKETKYELFSLKDNIVQEGDFFLGTGSIDGKSRYYYMQKNEDGSLEMKNISTNGVKIFPNQEENPYIVIKEYENKNPNNILEFVTSFKTEYEFHVPEGSISKEINVDLE